MVLLDENILLTKLNALLEIEVGELIKYSTTPACSEAKENKKSEYNQYKKTVGMLIDLKNYVLFSVFFP